MSIAVMLKWYISSQRMTGMISCGNWLAWRYVGIYLIALARNIALTGLPLQESESLTIFAVWRFGREINASW